jgi:hypothetical protein
LPYISALHKQLRAFAGAVSNAILTKPKCEAFSCLQFYMRVDVMCCPKLLPGSCVDLRDVDMYLSEIDRLNACKCSTASEQLTALSRECATFAQQRFKPPWLTKGLKREPSDSQRPSQQIQTFLTHLQD